MAREPEPLESVRALVCEPCWINCFDTEGFEKLGRGDVEEFRYNITGENIQAGIRIGCTWCLLIGEISLGIDRSSKTSEIILGASSEHVFTPTGSNFYQVYIGPKLGGSNRPVELEFSTECENFAAQQVTAREVDQDMTPLKTYSQIWKWLGECAQHPYCPHQTDSSLPTRLIEVATAKICHTNGAFGKFVALSYCWGSGSQTQLRSDNIEMLTQHLDVNDLPQTIKDAILVTRSLSIPYLWVDALCIIQDDVEDKAREIGSMAQIYSNAYITILASNAEHAADGFLAHPYEEVDPTARIPFRVAPNKFGSIIARQHLSRSSFIKMDNPLSTRAWTLQEQMMANRILDYTEHTLEWRCASSMMNLNDSLNVDSRDGPVPRLISQLSTNPEEALSDWRQIIEEYSSRSMSIQSDKLPAIAALAERFAAVLGQYHAGLWRYGLIRQLCWWSDQPVTERRDDLYKAPSWSWASAGRICMPRPICSDVDGVREGDCCNLVSVKVVRKNAHVPYGEVVHASLTICGKIIVASVSKLNRGGTWCLYPERTLIHANGGITERPLQRFYETYFHHIAKGVVPSLGAECGWNVLWDYKEFRSDPLVVLLLPLRYEWDPADANSIDITEGLILIPAGPGVVRRIGTFWSLDEHAIKGVVEQEITIV